MVLMVDRNTLAWLYVGCGLNCSSENHIDCETMFAKHKKVRNTNHLIIFKLTDVFSDFFFFYLIIPLLIHC